MPDICLEQDLRNLRFKHGKSSFKDNKFLMCGICEKKFSSQELVDNVIADWFGNESALRARLRLSVKNHSGPKIVNQSATERVMAEFMTHTLTNLHANMVDKSTCVFKMHVPIARQAGEEGNDSSCDVDLSKSLPPNRRSTKTHIKVTKA
jgi:hypothetical protein